MASSNSDYQRFMDAFVAAQPASVPKDVKFRKGQEAWKQVKLDLKEDHQALARKMGQLKVQALKIQNKSRERWAGFQIPPPKRRPANDPDEIVVLPTTSTSTVTSSGSADQNKGAQAEPAQSVEVEKITRATPAQDKKRAEISAIESKLAAYRQLHNTGLSEVNHKEAAKMGVDLEKKKKELNRLGSEAVRKQKSRANLKEAIKTVCNKDPEAAEVLKHHNRGVTGRPRKEVDQPGLLSAILNIVQASSVADDRRRCEALRTVTTLDDLVSELQKMNYQVSRSATYLRLLPRRGTSREGKRHVQTVPVKLLRPEASLRKKNIDRGYAMSFVKDAQQIEELFGPDVVLFLSNDDKARVPLGLAAATLQAPILMHLEYRVQLPDHSFVVGDRHKLIPSVYAVCNLKGDGSLDYSGDTFIRVRSGKHDTSSSYTHGYDIMDLFNSGSIKRKPILVIETDGASDEAPRFPKPLEVAIRIFIHLDLDALVHVVNASGLSAFNPCERRMAPLSHDISGVLLPHDTYGSHLNEQRETIDEELERKNFYAASDVLSEIWSNTIINGYKVECKTVKEGNEMEPEEIDPKWIAAHVRQARYSLQIVKCGKSDCCKPFSTNWLKVFPKRFLPAPAVYQFGARGLQALEPEEYVKLPKKYKFASLKDRLLLELKPRAASNFIRPPFDLYCPSMQDTLERSICKYCGSSWPCQAAVKRHAKCHGDLRKQKKLAPLDSASEDNTEGVEEEIEVECSDDEFPPLRGFRPDQGGPMPVFSTEEHVKPWFEELDHELEDEISSD